MNKKGFPQHLIRAVQSLYMETKIQINSGRKQIEATRETTQGVRQGCPLSPTLFNLYIDEVVTEWQTVLNCNYFIGDTPLNTLLFADDQILFADSEDNLQLAIFKLHNVAKDYNLKISHEKTKVFGFQGGRHIRTKIVLNNKTLEQVNIFNYLGCNISYIQQNDQEIKLEKFLRLIGTIKRSLLHKVQPETILKFYKTMAIPTLMYGSEVWSLTTTQYKRLEAAEMKLLRPVAGYTLLDHKRNEDIREEINITSVVDKIIEYRNNWYGHITRMPPNRIPQMLFHYHPTGKRNVGRPKKRWSDQF